MSPLQRVKGINVRKSCIIVLIVLTEYGIYLKRILSEYSHDILLLQFLKALIINECYSNFRVFWLQHSMGFNYIKTKL